MPLYGDILQANFFDFKNLINRQINGDLEPLRLEELNPIHFEDKDPE
jgi:hypothetical protein